MAYIFLDESGDLGFDFTKGRTSKYFVVTFLFVLGDKAPVEKVIKKIHSELREKKRRRVGVLHSTRESPKIRQRLLRKLAEKDCSIMAIVLNKSKVHTKLQDEKPVLYNFVANILLDRIHTKKLVPSGGTIELIASKRETNRFLNENFKNYLAKQVKSTHKRKLVISIKTPSEEKLLQAVDFVSWAIFRKYELKDESYYRLIKKRILEENPLFP